MVITSKSGCLSLTSPTRAATEGTNTTVEGQPIDTPTEVINATSSGQTIDTPTEGINATSSGQPLDTQTEGINATSSESGPEVSMNWKDFPQITDQQNVHDVHHNQET